MQTLEVTPAASLDKVPLERIETELSTLAAHINAATCRFLLLVAAFDRRLGWADWGCKSCAEYLSWRCGLSQRAGREQVRVAARLADFPQVTEAFAAGELSYSQVRAITRVATEDTEDLLLTIARHTPASRLERLSSMHAKVLRTNQCEGYEESLPDTFVHTHFDDDGYLVVMARLAPEQGAVLRKSLQAASDSLREDACPDGESGSAEPQDRAHYTFADALEVVAEGYLATAANTPTRAERYQVVVHVDAATLSGADPDGDCHLEDGGPLDLEVVRRMTCDANLVSLIERDGVPLGVGRKTRAISPALRRALNARDRTCRWPGCTQRDFTDAHHVVHWATGGPTTRDNLVLLCRHHHRLLHEAGFKLEGSGDQLLFRRPDGREISGEPRAIAVDGCLEDIQKDGSILADTCVPSWDGSDVDYDLCVWLLCRDDRRFEEARLRSA